MTPIAAGLRSPCGFTVTSKGDWFYAENQGEWVGSGHVTHVERGDFTGHPASLAWSGLVGSNVKLKVEDIPDDDVPNFEQAKKIPGMKTPAVWFPPHIMGISNSDIREDVTGGKFGPYAGQFYVGDQGPEQSHAHEPREGEGCVPGRLLFVSRRLRFRHHPPRLGRGRRALQRRDRARLGLGRRQGFRGSSALRGRARCLST